MLEGELEAELDLPWTRVTIKATKTSRGGLTEIRVTQSVVKGQVRGFQTSVVHTVKEIEDLGPKLNAITFTNSPVLIH